MFFSLFDIAKKAIFSVKWFWNLTALCEDNHGCHCFPVSFINVYKEKLLTRAAFEDVHLSQHSAVWK